VTPVRHRLQRVASAGPLARVRAAFFADRVLNRMVLYPRHVRRGVAGKFDLYHVVDHSYAQLVLDLPARRTVVTCHDVDTFRSLIDSGDPGHERRPAWFRAMSRRILRGLRRAELVVCGSGAARDEVAGLGLADASRLRVVPNGIDPALLEAPSARAAASAAALFPAEPGASDILHVGSDIPRKRLDRVLEIVAALHQRGRRVRLIRVGSPFRPETRQRARDLGVRDVFELPYLERDVLRAVYERAHLLLLPSDREGYGLPLVEALAAGKPVIASDIPALRESAGGLATCLAPDDLPAWIAAVEQALDTNDPDGRLAAARRARAAGLTWDHHVRRLLPVYAELLERARTSHP
jgi:glycosyltransferase involved in cell wall biosynthesis